MPPVLNENLRAITDRIAERSRDSRQDYLEKLGRTRRENPPRRRLSCGNMAHAAAACETSDQMAVATADRPNIGIVTAYNDMLSAHQPYGTYPDRIKRVARDMSATAQVAGGVPAMCDGVTQGQPGMELSLFSRDVIAMATAISLSHNTFDSALMLGVCDKIVPGLLMGALAFGHLPTLFVPAGPMTTGMPNDEKTQIRKAFIAGELDRAELLKAELRSYHGPGTCTFYGTANSNQMLMEVMGLHVPGAAFVNPGSALRDMLTDEATRWAARPESLPAIGEMLSEKSFTNAIVGLHATGGSTNHLIHLVAIARSAGIVLTWQDFAELSQVVPLLARIYPNGPADVNQFHAAGGLAFVIRELLDGGLLHPDVRTIAGDLRSYAQEPWLKDGALAFRDAPAESLDETILRPLSNPFEATGGLTVVSGNLGQAVVKADGTASVFLDPAKVTNELPGWLGDAVTLEAEDALPAALDALSGRKVLIDPAQSSAWYFDRLEAAGKGRVLLDMLAVLIKRRRAHAMQLAPCQGGLEQVGRVHGAIRLARAHKRMHLVDEQDDLARGSGDFGQDGLEPLLEFAAVLRPGDQRPHVEREQLLVTQALGHVAINDPQRQPLGDRGLAHAGFADQHRVVLGTPAQNLHGAPDLLVPTDDRVNLAFRRGFGQVTRIFLQRVIAFLGTGAVGGPALADVVDRAIQFLCGHSAQIECVLRPARDESERHQHAFHRHETVAGLACKRLGLADYPHQRAVGIDLAGITRNLRQLAQRCIHALDHARRLSPRAPDQIGCEPLVIVHQCLEQMNRHQPLMPFADRDRLGGVQEPARPLRELFKVHRSLLPQKRPSFAVPGTRHTPLAGLDRDLGSRAAGRKISAPWEPAVFRAGPPRQRETG